MVKEMRTITTCAGIGDFIWLAMKLINTGEKFNIIMPAALPQRGHQLAELLPSLINSITYKEGLTYRSIRSANVMNKHVVWHTIRANAFTLEANTHLEAGRRIEDFLPDLPTSYTLPYIGQESNYPSGWVSIYTSAYSNARHWGMWGVDEWFNLIKRLGKKYILIGAPYDVGITTELMQRMDADGIEYVSSIGEPLPVVVDILRRSKYFIGFPSGLSILAETLGVSNFMHYPVHLNKMVNAWASLDRIRSGEYIGRVNATPEQVYDLVKDKI